MRKRHSARENLLPAELHPVPGPAPGKHEPPLEERSDWDPWLPPRHAYANVSEPLRVFAGLILLGLAFSTALIMLFWLK